jgi:exopolysaccharide biosynthesis polyprenyl glycosylphosphotransferase
MANAFSPRPLILFAGDVLSLVAALWLSLLVRYFDIPSNGFFLAHLVPFSILFIVWIIVFVIAGLYEGRSIILARRALSATLLVAQVINIILAALFFFLIPYFGIAPKTILFIYLVISFLLILLWRVMLFPWLGLQKIEQAIVVGEGDEISSLVHALRVAPRAPTRIAQVVRPSDSSTTAALTQAVQHAIEKHHARFVIADFNDTRISNAFPELYNFLSQGIRFMDALPLYEEVFGRVPLSQMSEKWLARNASRYAHTLYDVLKRAMDVIIAFFGGAISLLLYPFIILAIKLDTKGPAIISMPRVGEGGEIFNLYKFRSMSGNDGGNYGPQGKSQFKVTRVGNFLRKSRLDELPQFWNMLRGDMSFIGPRPESPALVAVYEKEIPYYGVRHLLKPGASGWAQLYYHGDPHHGTDVEATKMKLAYDLYYLKHRSLALDVLITLKTIRRVLIKSNA